MTDTRFSIHKPKSSTKDKNIDSVECVLSVDDGVASIKCKMLDGFNAEIRLGYDGYKIIVVLMDSEDYMESLTIYKGV
tara:strand:- start:241 stop:474 length:234 start_codon:yes stop_codon:yes gene_type:complete